VAQKVILDSRFKVFEVNHSRHTTMHATKSLGTKPGLFKVVIALKCFKKKKSTGIYHILPSSDREVKHTLLYPQMHLFYLSGNNHENGWVQKYAM